jgi:hypothetical protein
LVPASIPCFRLSATGITSWPFEVNVALCVFMSYIAAKSKLSIQKLEMSDFGPCNEVPFRD